MPRFRRRQSSRSNGRKTYWRSCTGFMQSASFDNGYVFSFWARYPSGQVDPLSSHLVPSDETLVRSIVAIKTVLDYGIAPSIINPVTLGFGLIAVEGPSDPEAWELIIRDAATDMFTAPDPMNGYLDWIIRVPSIFNATGEVVGSGDRIFIESKAKRKLPPGVGILACYGFFGDAPETFLSGFDIRMALRSGYTA